MYFTNIWGRNLNAPTSQDWCFFPHMHKDIFWHMVEQGWFFQHIPPTGSYMEEVKRGKKQGIFVAVDLDHHRDYRVYRTGEQS